MHTFPKGISTLGKKTRSSRIYSRVTMCISYNENAIYIYIYIYMCVCVRARACPCVCTCAQIFFRCEGVFLEKPGFVQTQTSLLNIYLVQHQSAVENLSTNILDGSWPDTRSHPPFDRSYFSSYPDRWPLDHRPDRPGWHGAIDTRIWHCVYIHNLYKYAYNFGVYGCAYINA